MLREAIAVIVMGCVIGLSFGALSRDSHAASELETAVLDQRHAVPIVQAAALPKCPTIQEIAASRNEIARSASSTAAYRDARDIADWLAQCRAQIGWELSMLKQTPEGRAYIARVAARIQERLRLECVCEGVWVTLDPAFANGPAFAVGGVMTFDCANCGIPTAFVTYWNPQQAWDNLTQAQKDHLRAGGTLALAALVAAGVITGPQAALIAAYIAFEWTRVAVMQEQSGGWGFRAGGGGDREIDH